MPIEMTAEQRRLKEDAARRANWKRWGPYLSERQWGTVREDYSPGGSCWDYFGHDQARSRAYRWGEDGLLGITDRQARLCFALALWNGQDSIVKERLFGLTGPQGNHGEDVKEEYFYLDSTPTHSWMRALYKYPQRAFPYQQLVDVNAARGKQEPEFELRDTGTFDDDRFFDVEVRYAKAADDDIAIEIAVTNHAAETAPLHLLPTLWARNTWSWGCRHEGCGVRPLLVGEGNATVRAYHPDLGEYSLQFGPAPDGTAPTLLFTENETNLQRLFGATNTGLYVKDAFHDYLIAARHDAVNPARRGTKAAGHYKLDIRAGETVTLRLRLANAVAHPQQRDPLGTDFEQVVAARRREADEFYAALEAPASSPAARAAARQAYAGLLWSKQFYHYIVNDWLEGDADQPAPPAERSRGRNHDWKHLYNRDVISMPDKWEYPWYAAWDLAFHMIPMAKVDPQFAKQQLLLFLREWYMHPNGQLPAYEFAFGDVNPPVHAWAVWRVYKISAKRGERDLVWLKRCFQKLLLNFNWWVNRKDPHGNHVFGGGFLGMDNIGVFDRSQPLPTGGHLEQADGTAWMAFYSSTMLAMALELALHDESYEDMASKFLEHFVAIADAINNVGGTGLWDDADGFYYDHLHVEGQSQPLKIRSLVGLVPLLAVEVLEQSTIDRLPGFKRRLEWFVANRHDLARSLSYLTEGRGAMAGHRLLAIPSRERLLGALRYLLDENEFLAPHGIRSLSRVHSERPYEYHHAGTTHRVTYTPAESDTGLFGGNSNWRGPIWFPLNFLLVEALERYDHFYGEELTVEMPYGSGQRLSLAEVASQLAARLSALFIPDAQGRRPVHGDDLRYRDHRAWKELVLFYEYFDGDTGRGVGASHQTGWTALAAIFLAAGANRPQPHDHQHHDHASRL